MSLGGGGFGGGGLPFATDVLQLVGGDLRRVPLTTPAAPEVLKDDASGAHRYAVIGVGVQGERTAASPTVEAQGRATLVWDSVAGADAYIVVRDKKEITQPIRIEGAKKVWTDDVSP